MLVVRGIAKICCWVSNCMLFFCLLGVFVEGVLEGVSEENRSTVIELIMFGVLIFFARVRLGHFLYQTEGKTYRYEGVFARYYPGYYIDLITLIVTFLIVIVSGVSYAYFEWWIE